MNLKYYLAAASALAAAAILLLTFELIRERRVDRIAPPREELEIVTRIPAASPELPEVRGIIDRNIFMRKRAAPGVPATGEGISEQNGLGEITMLEAYPDAWPRLKLTGVCVLNGRAGAIVNGGSARPVTSGDQFDSFYFTGDEIGDGVRLGRVSRDSVLLVKENQGWTIQIGADPPVVVKKQ